MLLSHTSITKWGITKSIFEIWHGYTGSICKGQSDTEIRITCVFLVITLWSEKDLNHSIDGRFCKTGKSYVTKSWVKVHICHTIFYIPLSRGSARKRSPYSLRIEAWSVYVLSSPDPAGYTEYVGLVLYYEQMYKHI